jgi:hypothetical protein
MPSTGRRRVSAILRSLRRIRGPRFSIMEPRGLKTTLMTRVC